MLFKFQSAGQWLLCWWSQHDTHMHALTYSHSLAHAHTQSWLSECRTCATPLLDSPYLFFIFRKTHLLPSPSREKPWINTPTRRNPSCCRLHSVICSRNWSSGVWWDTWYGPSRLSLEQGQLSDLIRRWTAFLRWFRLQMTEAEETGAQICGSPEESTFNYVVVT